MANGQFYNLAVMLGLPYNGRAQRQQFGSSVASHRALRAMRVGGSIGGIVHLS